MAISRVPRTSLRKLIPFASSFSSVAAAAAPSSLPTVITDEELRLTRPSLSFVVHSLFRHELSRGRVLVHERHGNFRRPLSFASRTSRVHNAGALAMCAKKCVHRTPKPTRFAPFPTSLSAPAASYSIAANFEGRAIPRDTNFNRYSKFLVKNSTVVDGLLGLGQPGGSDGTKELISWLDDLRSDQCLNYQDERLGISRNAPRPFSILSWNILAQKLYDANSRRRRVQQVALALPFDQLPHASLSTSSPHPWKRRARRILEVLSHSGSDIICLQECELLSFKEDLAPALFRLGYDGIAQEDDRPDKPISLDEVTKHRSPRNHIVATFWRREKFLAVDNAMVRTRSLTTVLRLKPADGGEDNKEHKAMPTVAIINVHLEGHPRCFLERTHQLQHAMVDLAKRIQRERTVSHKGVSAVTDQPSQIGKLNALVISGDFNCELQSSACSAYLRMGRLGRQAGLGGVHGEDSLVLPPTLLETTEAMEVIHPIMEWGRALPEDKLVDVVAHPFRRNGMMSAYPPWLGKNDARDHFTFCSELNKCPVPGLDQMWFSSTTLERRGLRRMFINDSSRLWEQYFRDDEETERWRDEERRRILMSGLPSLECEYPSDHLPIGALFGWKWDGCDDSCLLGNTDCAGAEFMDVGEVRGLNVLDSEGNDVQDDVMQDLQEQHKKMQQPQPSFSFENPHDELSHLLQCCPFESAGQESDVLFILSPPVPPLHPGLNERPTQDQLNQLEVRRTKKIEVLKDASMGVRPWLKNILKVNKQASKWDRQRFIEKAKLMGKRAG